MVDDILDVDVCMHVVAAVVPLHVDAVILNMVMVDYVVVDMERTPLQKTKRVQETRVR